MGLFFVGYHIYLDATLVTAHPGTKKCFHPQSGASSDTAIEQCRQPVIAVVHGGCVGAGVDLISACDIRLCTADAWFCVKEVAIGLAAFRELGGVGF